LIFDEKTNRLNEEVLARIRRHSAGVEDKKSRAIGCHYCGHKTIMVYEDSTGYVNAKCKKCRRNAIYNVALRRRSAAMPAYWMW